MKTVKALLLLTMMLSLLAACNKKIEAPVTPTPAPRMANYFPMTPGSYWVYARTWRDSSGNDTGEPVVYDSSYIVKDTVIGMVKYAIMHITNPYGSGSTSDEIVLLRDSSGWILNNWGYVQVQNVGKPSALPDYYYVYNTSDTMYKVSAQIDAATTDVMTAAGHFEAKSVTRTFHYSPWHPVRYRDPRVYHTYYADSVGMVLAEYSGYIDGPLNYVEQRLVRYHVEH